MPGLCPDLDWARMERPHVVALAPHILGVTVWERIQDEDFDSWASFEKVVQKDYGLTGAEIRRGFTSLTKRPTEADEAFILRVEEARRAGGHSR